MAHVLAQSEHEMQTRQENIPQDYQVFMCQRPDTTNSYGLAGWVGGGEQSTEHKMDK